MTTTDGSDLVQKQRQVRDFEGAPLGDDIARSIKDVTNDNWATLGLDVGIVGLDLLGAALNPFGTLFGSIAGYLIEHFGPARDVMDALTGNPRGIEAASETWKHIGERLSEASTEYTTAVGEVGGAWRDGSYTAYRSVGQNYADCLSGIALYSELFSEGITIGGMLCAEARQDIYNALGDLLFELAMEGLAALAAAGFTFGATLAGWLEAVALQAELFGAWLADRIASLLAKVGKVAAKFAKDGTKLAKIAQDLDKLSHEMGEDASKLRQRVASDRGHGDTPPRHSSATPPPTREPTAPSSGSAPDGPGSGPADPGGSAPGGPEGPADPGGSAPDGPGSSAPDTPGSGDDGSVSTPSGEPKHREPEPANPGREALEQADKQARRARDEATSHDPQP